MDESELLFTSCKKSEYDISIVIPTYKRGVQLYASILSAINQEESGLSCEVIVVNNDPDDRMESMIDKCKGFYDLSFYRNNNNLGMIGNMNRCAILAKGIFVAYLHDDDVLLPHYLKTVNKCIKRIGVDNVDALILNRLSVRNYLCKKYKILSIVKESTKFLISLPLFFRYFYRRSIIRLSSEDVLIAWRKNYYLAPTCGSMIRRSEFLAFGGWDLNLFPVFDFDFFLNFNENHKIWFCRKITGEYVWENNASLKKETILKTTAYRINLVNNIYNNKRLDSYFLRFKNTLIWLEEKQLEQQFKQKLHVDITQNDINELKGIVDYCYTKPSKMAVFSYVFRNYLYRVIHNLDY